MQKFTKITFIMLFLPSIGLAATCTPDDTACKTLQDQLAAMEKMGIKPTQVIQPTSAEEKKDTKKTTLQPFKIPFPPFAKRPTQGESDKDHEQQTNSIEPQAGMLLNTLNSNNNNQQESSATDSSTTYPQPATIQYR